MIKPNIVKFERKTIMKSKKVISLLVGICGIISGIFTSVILKTDSGR